MDHGVQCEKEYDTYACQNCMNVTNLKRCPNQHPKDKEKTYMAKYLPAELLLKLSDKLGMDLAEWFPQSIRNMDHNSLSVSSYINLTAKISRIKHYHTEVPIKNRIRMQIMHTYFAELMYRSFKSLLSSWCVFSKSNKACSDKIDRNQ